MRSRASSLCKTEYLCKVLKYRLNCHDITRDIIIFLSHSFKLFGYQNNSTKASKSRAKPGSRYSKYAYIIFDQLLLTLISEAMEF